MGRPHLTPEARARVDAGPAGRAGSGFSYTECAICMGQFRWVPAALARALVIGLLLSAGGCALFKPARRRFCRPRSSISSARPSSATSGTTRRDRISGRSSSDIRTRPTPRGPLLPRRRGVLSRGGVRQGGPRVRGVPGLLSPAPDRRSRPVPARHELLRPDQAGGAGPGLTLKAMEQFGSSSRSMPASRYATDAREDRRLPRPARQKELWVATYYFTRAIPAPRVSDSSWF